MAKNDDCEPVFHMSWNDPDPNSGDLSISLRDWFAGQALTGLLIYPGTQVDKEIAWRAYSIADDLLEA